MVILRTCKPSNYQIMRILPICAASGLFLGITSAAPLKTAVVTTVVNDVKLSERSAAAKPIGVGQAMGGSSTLLTGRKSRAALTFPDKTVSRVGANSVFRFSSGSRDMEISQGSFLLQVPKGAGGATIRTSTVVAGISGTTTMMEFNPGISVKFICLEGTAKLTNKKGDSVQIPPGHMLMMHPDAPKFPRPVMVDVKRMLKTSALADEGAFGGLEPEAMAAISETIARQMQGKRDGSLQPAGLGGSGDVANNGSKNNGNGSGSVGGPRTLLPEAESSGKYPGFGPSLRTQNAGKGSHGSAN
jgi:hypothetical protein